MSASGTTYDSITAKSKSADPFHDAVTSSLITPHSIAQMQNLLDSLDHTSKSSKDNLLSFFVQSMFQSFLPPDLKHVAMGANTQLPLVQNMSTRDGNCCLVKDQWALPDNARPNQTSIHLRFACPLELINRRITDWSRLEEFMNALQDVTKAHAEVATHCDWVHGEITPLNMLIDRDGKGVLTDWDHQMGKQDY